jgi:3-deoxy-D-manno-octulosonic acid (KDO) 8-phosphate synthase
METHFDPSIARSDGPNMVPLRHMAWLLRHLQAISKCGFKDADNPVGAP